MSGEEMASSYSFGEFDDFSEFDIQGGNDETDSVDLYAGSGVIPKSNILILSDIEESFVVLGRDILKSIKYYSREEHSESEDCDSESATFSSKETIIEKSDKFGITSKNNKKTLSNLKDVTERFRSASSPLPCDSNNISPSNEAFFNSTAKNHCKNIDSDTDVDKLLKEIMQSLRPAIKVKSKKQNQKCRMKDNFDNMTVLEGKVISISDQLSRLKYHDLNDATSNAMNDFESRDLQFPAEIKLKRVSETFGDSSEKLSASSLMRNISESSNLDNYENSETVKIRELKKVIDESLSDGSNADERTKKLLHNLKYSIEIYENSNCNIASHNENSNYNIDSYNEKAKCNIDSRNENAKCNIDSRNENAKCESAPNVNEQNISREQKGLTEKIARTLNYAMAINFLLFIVFIVFVYFWGLIVMDMLKMSDVLIKTASKIESIQRWPFI